MRRDEIDEKFKWDLSSMYASKEEYEKDFNEVKNKLGDIEKFKGAFLNSVEDFIEFMSFSEFMERKIEKLYTFAHLAVDVEPENQEMQTLSANIIGLEEDYSNRTVFVNLDILKNEDKALEIIKDERCKKYSNMINSVLRTKPHVLSDDVEAVLAQASGVLGNSYKTYTSIRPTFKPVIIDGKEHFLNEETVKEFLKNKDENIRKQAYENLNIEYKKFANVYANTF